MHQEIRWFDVSMNHVFLVNNLEPIHDLPENVNYLGLPQLTPFPFDVTLEVRLAVF